MFIYLVILIDIIRDIKKEIYNYIYNVKELNYDDYYLFNDNFIFYFNNIKNNIDFVQNEKNINLIVDLIYNVINNNSIHYRCLDQFRIYDFARESFFNEILIKLINKLDEITIKNYINAMYFKKENKNKIYQLKYTNKLYKFKFFIDYLQKENKNDYSNNLKLYFSNIYFFDNIYKKKLDIYNNEYFDNITNETKEYIKKYEEDLFNEYVDLLDPVFSNSKSAAKRFN